jgi:hypothetical protein
MPEASRRNEVGRAKPVSRDGRTLILLNYKVHLPIMDHGLMAELQNPKRALLRYVSRYVS